MEKFSNWRDKGTGISPFMPEALPLTAATGVKKAGLAVVKTLLFTAKLPVTVLLIALYYVTGIAALIKLVVLVFFGFNRLEVLVDGVKRSNVAKINASLPRVGDLVVVNWSSPIDGLIIAAVSGNWKNVALLVPDQRGELYHFTVWKLFRHTFDSSVRGKTVDDISKFKNKIVFLLAEGTPSNNKALLPFLRVNTNKQQLESFNIKSLVLKLSPGYLTLPIAHVSKLRYLFELLSNTDIRYNLIKAKVYQFDKWDVAAIRDSFRINGLELVGDSLNIEHKRKFVDYYFNFNVKKTN